MTPCEGIEPRTTVDLEQLNACLDQSSAEEVVDWAARTFGDGLVLSTSFGIQSAAMLHLVTSVVPRIPVVWVDTGYLPPETYRFADELSRRLDLNLHVAQADLSPARMEALYGRPWELESYDKMRKVEPMQRALEELNATAWLAGLRADQTQHRSGLPVLGRQGERFKVLPILRWHSRDVHRYLKAHDLPYHPLFEQGYASVGDSHSSRPVQAGDAHERDTRFGGLKEECGLHLDAEEAASLESSQL